jgi:hypothetical protein
MKAIVTATTKASDSPVKKRKGELQQQLFSQDTQEQRHWEMIYNVPLILLLLKLLFQWSVPLNLLKKQLLLWLLLT